MFKVIKSDPSSAQENMEKDQKLLENIKSHDPAILHFYNWMGPSLTYGYFIDPKKFLQIDQLEKQNIQYARRPTGGGIVFHLWDLAFSVIVPANHPGFFQNTLDNYKYINQKVLIAAEKYLQRFSPLQLLPSDAMPLDEACKQFCMAKPSKYDVMLHGKKIAGAAQRRKQHAYLHQGTISLVKPDKEILLNTLAQDTQVMQAMLANTFYLLEDYSLEAINQARMDMMYLLEETFMETK